MATKTRTYSSTTGSCCDSSEVPMVSLPVKLELTATSACPGMAGLSDVATAILVEVEANNFSADWFMFMRFVII